MLSSTSNSERRTLKSIATLLALLVVGEVVLQQGATWVLRHYGKNELRWEAERKAASALVHDGKGVMLIGSSVLLGVDGAQLQSEMPDWRVRRMVMVAAAYTDWYYSLRRLYAEGVRPDYVVVPPLPFQITSDGFRGDYLPLHWIARQDIPQLSREKNLGLTETSNLLFASYNSFFALRDDFRNAFLGAVIPGHKVLAAGLPDKRGRPNEDIEKQTGERLAALQALVAEQGAKLIILHYPAPGMDAGWRIVERVTAAKGIPFVSAVPSMPLERFEDGLHLDPEGTKEFTRLLGPALNAELARLSHGAGRSQPVAAKP